ncbi:MAG: Tfp pilus assembly protein FimT [Cryomorphaceae bacterium]|jgi:Tfp pilus assembly protein FimT
MIELLFTMVVMAVLATLAAPSFSSFSQRQSIRGDNQIALKAFTTARMQAMVNDTASSFVCWNLSAAPVNMSGGGTTHVLSPGDIVVTEGTSGSFGEVILRGDIVADGAAAFSNDADDCIEFDSQGRMTAGTATATPLIVTFCRGVNDIEDSINLSISASGRVSSQLNSVASACS